MPEKVVRSILDFVEIYLPMAAFPPSLQCSYWEYSSDIFLLPLHGPWNCPCYALSGQLSLGGLYAKRTNSHVKFTLIYDLLSQKAQLWMRLSGNGLLLFSFLLGFVPSFKYVLFMGFKKSNVLKIPMDIAFSPFVISMAFMIGHLIHDIYSDVKNAVSIRGLYGKLNYGFTGLIGSLLRLNIWGNGGNFPILGHWGDFDLLVPYSLNSLNIGAPGPRRVPGKPRRSLKGL